MYVLYVHYQFKKRRTTPSKKAHTYHPGLKLMYDYGTVSKNWVCITRPNSTKDSLKISSLPLKTILSRPAPFLPIQILTEVQAFLVFSLNLGWLQHLAFAHFCLFLLHETLLQMYRAWLYFERISLQYTSYFDILEIEIIIGYDDNWKDSRILWEGHIHLVIPRAVRRRAGWNLFPVPSLWIQIEYPPPSSLSKGPPQNRALRKLSLRILS